jgi:hypothetical protein
MVALAMEEPAPPNGRRFADVDESGVRHRTGWNSKIAE